MSLQDKIADSLAKQDNLSLAIYMDRVDIVKRMTLNLFELTVKDLIWILECRAVLIMTWILQNTSSIPLCTKPEFRSTIESFRFFRCMDAGMVSVLKPLNFSLQWTEYTRKECEEPYRKIPFLSEEELKSRANQLLDLKGLLQPQHLTSLIAPSPKELETSIRELLRIYKEYHFGEPFPWDHVPDIRSVFRVAMQDQDVDLVDFLHQQKPEVLVENSWWITGLKSTSLRMWALRLADKTQHCLQIGACGRTNLHLATLLFALGATDIFIAVQGAYESRDPKLIALIDDHTPCVDRGAVMSSALIGAAKTRDTNYYAELTATDPNANHLWAFQKACKIGCLPIAAIAWSHVHLKNTDVQAGVAFLQAAFRHAEHPEEADAILSFLFETNGDDRYEHTSLVMGSAIRKQDIALVRKCIDRGLLDPSKNPDAWKEYCYSLKVVCSYAINNPQIIQLFCSAYNNKDESFADFLSNNIRWMLDDFVHCGRRSLPALFAIPIM